jgi:hypothetical protein
MKGFKWLGILVAVVLIVAMCVVPVSASPAVTTPVNTRGLNAEATPPTVTTQAATGTVVNANGQTAGYFHGTLTAKGTNDTSAIQVWFEYGTTTSYGSTTTKVTMNKTGTFSAKIPANLTVGTTYDYKAVAEYVDAGGGAATGSNQTFEYNYPVMTGTYSCQISAWTKNLVGVQQVHVGSMTITVTTQSGTTISAASVKLSDLFSTTASAVTGIVGPIGAHTYMYLTGIDNTTHLNTVIICKVILNSNGTVRSISGTIQAVVGTTTPSWFISNFNGTYHAGD